MKITHSSPTLYTVSAASYGLEITEDSVSVILAGEKIARINPRSALNTTNDDNESCTPDIECGDLSFEMLSPSSFRWTSKSSLWEEKIYTLTAYEDRAEYEITVKGKGRVDSVNYFCHHLLDDKNNVRNIAGSQEFYEGFYPNIFQSSADGTYAASDPQYTFSILSVPPMFFHSYRIAGMDPLLAFGVVAQMGEHNFTKLKYDPNFSFETDQDGHTVVDGEWTAPKMVIYSATDHYNAAERYCSFYFDQGICSRGEGGEKPRFWYGPIACGWLEQLAYSYLPESHGWMLQSCKEPLYNAMLEKLEKKGLENHILIIDDKWQDKYGTAHPHPDRWPDLRGFIDRNLEKDIHTFMWYRLWDNEDIPEEYCVWDEKNGKYVCDPTNPGYQAILRENIHRIISDEEGCYNAEGLKLDFAFWHPHGRKAQTYSGKYGAELIYEYIKIIRDAMKAAKPHAVVNASPCHPIFASLVDQARLHDYDSSNRMCLEVFTHRAKIWGTALPNALIDTDSGSIGSHRDTMRFLLNQSKIGIPDLYYVSDFPDFILSDEEWGRVSDEWKKYNEKMDRLH